VNTKLIYFYIIAFNWYLFRLVKISENFGLIDIIIFCISSLIITTLYFILNNIKIPFDNDDKIRDNLQREYLRISKLGCNIFGDRDYLCTITNDDFEKAVNNNDLKRAKFLWELDNKNIDLYAGSGNIFGYCCRKNYIDIAKWLWEISNHSFNVQINDNDILIVCCQNGYLDTAKWIWGISNKKINFNTKENITFFWDDCKNGLEVVNWLWEISNHSLNLNDVFYNNYKKNYDIVKWAFDKDNYAIDLHKNNEESFTYYCENNNLEMAKWVWEKTNNSVNLGSSSSLNYNKEQYFINCCKLRNKEIVEWLISINKKKYNGAFLNLCNNGYLDELKWIYKINKNAFNMHISNEKAFCIQHRNGLEIAKWLIEIGKDCTNIQNAFKSSCSVDQIEIAKWLYQTYRDKIDIHKNNCEIFYNCCGGYNLGAPRFKIVRWLCELCDDYIVIYDGLNISNYYVKNDFDKIFGDNNSNSSNDDNNEIDELKKKLKWKAEYKHKKNKCPICLVKLKREDNIINLKCKDNKNHSYCLTCFKDWYKNNVGYCLLCNDKINYKKLTLYSK
jgi:hypothetical protein